MITFRCEHCGKQFRVEDKFAGRRTNCRGCGEEIHIPSADQAVDIEPAELPEGELQGAAGPARRTRTRGRVRQPRAARAGGGEFFMVPIFDGLLGIFRNMFAGDGVVKLGRVFAKIGLWSMFGLIAVVAGFQFYVAVEYDRAGLIWTGVGALLVGLVLQYIAARFMRVADRLIDASPSHLTNTAILDTIGLLSLICGIISLVQGIAQAIDAENIDTVWPGVLQFVAFIAIAAVALNPASVNTHESQTANAGEEAIGIVGFFLKLMLRTAPILFGISVVVLTLAGAYHFIMFASEENQHVNGMKMGEVMLDGLLAAAIPLGAYLLFVFGHLMIDLMRGTLSLLTIRDRLTPPDA